MAETVRSSRSDRRLTVLPLFYEADTIFVLNVQYSRGGNSHVHLDRAELERYRDLIDSALAQKPDELPDGCTCTLSVYGQRVRDVDCPTHAELERLEPVAPGEETA